MKPIDCCKIIFIKNKKYLLIFFVLFFCAIPFIFSIDKLVIQSSADYFIKNPPNLFNNFFGWHSVNLGDNNLDLLWKLFPLNLIYFASNGLIGIPPNITQFFILSFLFFIGFISFYILIKELFKNQKINKTAILIGALFFIYNLYVLTFLPNSYFMITPYVFLPLQFYLFIKGIRTNKLLKYSIFLAFVNSLVFGFNLIFDVIAIVLLLGYGLWSALVVKEIKLKRLIKFSALAGALTFLFIIWWILPMIYGSVIDEATTQSVLTSESFYNNDSSLNNIFRNLGDWGFFSGHQGIPYKNFSPAYKHNLIILISGFAIPIIVFFPLLFFAKIKGREYKKKILFFYIAIILLFPFIGGIYKSWPTNGLMQWLFDNVPYFMAFRNTYKWTAIAVLFYAMLVTIFLNHILSKKRENVEQYFLLKYFIPLLVLAAIAINAFPFFSGRLFEKNSQIKNIPKYWHQAADYINNSLIAAENRILLLPDQYFAVFKWNNQMKSIPRGLADTLLKIPVVHNACVGCGNYHTSKVYDFIYDNLKSKNIDKFLGLINISHIFQRNDFYSEYYKVEEPEEVKEIISSHSSISSEASFNMLDLYKLQDDLVYPRIYSPSKIVVTDTFNESLDIFDKFNLDGEKLSFIISSQADSNDLTLKHANYYKKILKKENIEFKNNITAENFEILTGNNYNISRNENYGFNAYQIYYYYDNKDCILRFKNVNEKLFIDDSFADGNAVENFEKEISLGIELSEPIGIEIENKIFYLRPGDKWQYLDSMRLEPKDFYAVNIYKIDKKNNINLLENNSFEKGFWNEKVGNCNFNNPDAKILMDLTKDASDGQSALLLSAEEDSACSYSRTIKEFEPDTVYFLSFDCKNISGSAPAFCVWNGKGCAKDGEALVSKNWQTHEMLVKLSPEAKQFIMYFYSHKNKGPVTVNLYDNVKVYKITKPIKQIILELPYVSEFSEDIFLKSGEHKISAVIFKDELNLLENNSFEKGFWNEKVGNCRLSDPDALLEMKLIPDSTDGKAALELSAEKDAACVSSAPIKKFSKDKAYAVSFDYKIVAGNAARFCVWDGNVCVKTEDLKKVDDGWHYYETIFEPNIDSEFLNIYFYASAEKVENAVVRYDNVAINIVENKILDAYYLKTKDEKKISQSNINFEKVNPVYYKLLLKQKDASLIIFQESFHPGWRAYIQGEKSPQNFLQKARRHFGFWNEKEIARDNHIIANGFANAWWIDANDICKDKNFCNKNQDRTYDMEMIIEFWPQRWFYSGLFVSGIIFLGCITYLTADFVKRRRQRSKQFRNLFNFLD
ncbi:DUF3367 domain-containing protein [Candidatus Parcubacteria bacterium]|nr:DUF3367 domain-containing protein [Candidatus Parcubacteria bacterium]